jgi:hypothetical protein
MNIPFQEALLRIGEGWILRPVLMNTSGVPNLGVQIAIDKDGNTLESAPLQLCRAWSDGSTSLIGCLLFRVEYAFCEWETVPTLPNPGPRILPLPEQSIDITPPRAC